jgi:hypothetical protein
LKCQKNQNESRSEVTKIILFDFAFSYLERKEEV